MVTPLRRHPGRLGARRMMTVVLGAGLVLAGGSGPASGTAFRTTSSEPSATTAAVPSSSGAWGGTKPGPVLVAGHYQPVWPFGNLAEVRAWQRAHDRSGKDAWHLDPGKTALRFTRDLLRFKEINVEVGRSVQGRHARVKVGYRSSESGRPAVAAVVHLVRFGDGEDAPWEVVGTDDEHLSLTTPAYGSAVRFPVTVGGKIRGVDESLRVQALRRHPARVLGSSCCEPAGGLGTAQPWRVELKLSSKAKRGEVLTLVVWTGGHVADVERFAITAVRVA
ncbi:hypothetical protein [Nonomuraea rubra]|uniref:hypothetical protein n=1 Tax=Nonomuraea rubra TaxID=46180 RepID=UPI0033D1F52A